MAKTFSLFDTLAALILVPLIMLTSTLLARTVLDSSLYRQSRIVSMLMQQESISLAGLLENTRDAEVIVKFAGALASAYINFEMIPINEASTFMAVFESLPDDVTVKGLEYRRKDLVIAGTAGSILDFTGFMDALRRRGHFASVSGSHFDGKDGRVHFEIICTALERGIYNGPISFY